MSSTRCQYCYLVLHVLYYMPGERTGIAQNAVKGLIVRADGGHTYPSL